MLSAPKYLKNTSYEFIYRRPLFYICVAYICGIVLSYTLKPPTVLSLALFLIVSALSFWANRRHDITIFILVLVMLFGSFYSSLFFNRESSYESGEEYVMDAVVSDTPVIEEGRTSYVVRPENGQAIILRVYNPSQNYKYGDMLRLKIKVEIPKGETNPGGFNYRDYLKRSGIYATASASEGDIQYIGHRADIKAPLIISRQWVENTINRLYPTEEAAFLNSLIIGDRTDLESSVEESFINTGIIHALAISGLHVNILLLFIFYILRFLKLSEAKRNAIALACIGFYTLMVGAMPSVVRAFIMAAVILIGRAYDEETDTLSAIALAALIILFINPLKLYDIGFQLSFGATLSILLFYKKISGMLPFKGYIADTVGLTLSAEIGVLPVSIYYFYRLPLYSLLANLVVVPIIPVIFVLGIISIVLGAVFMPMSYIFILINSMLIRLSVAATGVMSSLPHASVIIPRPYMVAIIAYYLLVCIALGFINVPRKKYVIASLVLLISAGTFFKPIYKDMNITFIDVGQGDSSLVRLGTSNILIDGGGSPPSKYSDFNVGEDVLIPYLLANHVTEIDAVFISHEDNDHMGGIIPLVEEMRVGHIFMGKKPEDNIMFNRLQEIALEKDIPITYLHRGDRVSLDKIDIFVLNPEEGTQDENNGSLVFKLSYKDADVLYTGDIEIKGESDILNSGLDIGSEVLKVAHHGSSTSSAGVFLDMVKPEISIISVGKNNYGHPNESVLSRLSEYSKVYRTDMDGAVIIDTDGRYIKVKKWGGSYGL